MLAIRLSISPLRMRWLLASPSDVRAKSPAAGPMSRRMIAWAASAFSIFVSSLALSLPVMASACCSTAAALMVGM